MTNFNYEHLIKILRTSSHLPAIAAGICNLIYTQDKDCPIELLMLIVELCCRSDDGDVCLKVCNDERASNINSQAQVHTYEVTARVLSAFNQCLKNDREEDRRELTDESEPFEALKSRFGSDLENFTSNDLNKALQATALKNVKDNARSPLVFDCGRLYFRRDFAYETYVASFIKKRRCSNLPNDPSSFAYAKSCLKALFKDNDASKSTKDPANAGVLDRQKCAAALALLSNFTVISGGPGTGKTTTVTKLLLLMLAVLKKEGRDHARVMLCAPTGKAAGRLGASLEQQLDLSKKSAVCDFIKDQHLEELLSYIPRRASTVHSLIGVRPHSSHCHYDENNKLPCDIMIVDEVSMVDLMLFKKLCAALRDDAVLILLGDKDQLRSVEAGAVMADLCTKQKRNEKTIKALSYLLDTNESNFPADVGSQVMLLKKSFRFREDSVIGNLAFMVRDASELKKTEDDLAQDLSHFKKNFPQQAEQVLHFYESTESKSALRTLLDTSMSNEGYLPFINFIKAHKHMTPMHAQQALELLDKFRVLCSNRRGIFGCSRINRELKNAVIKQTSIRRGEWFAGRVVMATENSASVGIHNGDVGFVALDENDHLRVWFADENGSARALSTVYLTSCEDAYAMTVHKSQGSEYAHVILALSDQDNAVMCRELIYTGITRARAEIEIYAEEELFKKACLRTVRRESGLALRLM